ncbi:MULTISPECIES: hypothetical protein [unclassified Streptomyces]|uniref:hypothetical protein n=1 Tax=unclassified Streptomyces TaxID=2593676 RepID=UPI00332F4203
MTLTRGARITGAVLCAALAVIVGGWIVRDLGVLDDPLGLWRFWMGEGQRGAGSARLATTLATLLLLVVYVCVGAAALRPNAGAAAPAVAGIVTLALWIPGLWVLSSSWMDLRATDDLRTRALYCVFAATGLGVGLLIVAAAGRQVPSSPLRPQRDSGLPAAVLLGASAVVLAGWEIRAAVRSGGGAYLDRFTGSKSVMLPPLGTPPGWQAAVIVLLAVVAGSAALSQAAFARPLGLVSALLILGEGARGVDATVRKDLVPRLGELSGLDQLLVLSWLFEAAAGVLLLVVLSRRAPAVQPVYGWAPGPPPPSRRPPGW